MMYRAQDFRSHASSWMLSLLLVLLLAAPAAAQQDGTPPGSQDPGEEQTNATTQPTDPDSVLLQDLIEDTICAADECCPPSTQEKVMIGLGTVVLFLLSFLLLRKLVERRYINTDRNALLGRHLGLSGTIFLTALGAAGLVYAITGCVHREAWVWLGIATALWVIHLIYTLIIVRSE